MPKRVYVGADITCTNILTNGALSSNTNGWTLPSSNAHTNVVQQNGYIQLQMTGGYYGVTKNDWMYQSFAPIRGNTNAMSKQIIYAQAKIRAASNNKYAPSVSIRYTSTSSTQAWSNLSEINGVSGTDLNDNQWHTMRGHFPTYKNTTGFTFDRICFGELNVSNASGDTIDVKEVMLINLTEAFGQGNEPEIDWCDQNLSFFENTITVDTNKARRVKEIYIGIEGVARRIRKAYVGYNGKARLCWPGWDLSYCGTTTNMSTRSAEYPGATSVGNYALFGGGRYYDTSRQKNVFTSTVNAYSSKLVRVTPTSLKTWGSDIGATTNGKYALFAGGYDGSASSNPDMYQASVTVYDDSLTLISTKSLQIGSYAVAGAQSGKYAIFAGGRGSSTYWAYVRAFNQSLTAYNLTNLSVARSTMFGTTVGKYAIFAGGYTGSASNIVDVYDGTTKLQTGYSNLGTARYRGASASSGGLAYFAGGASGSTNYSTVEIYNVNLTKTTASALSSAKSMLTGIGLYGYVLFGGGSGPSATVDAYNGSSRTSATQLSSARYQLVSATAGHYALFAGGRTSSVNGDEVATVDVYQVV